MKNKELPKRLKITMQELDKILEDYGLMYSPFDKRKKQEYRFHVSKTGNIVSLISMVQLDIADLELLVNRLLELKQEKKENETPAFIGYEQINIFDKEEKKENEKIIQKTQQK